MRLKAKVLMPPPATIYKLSNITNLTSVLPNVVSGRLKVVFDRSFVCDLINISMIIIVSYR